MNQTQHKVIVSKFGGSSMKDAQAIRRSANIAKEKNSSVVVVSATYGTTNQLIELAQTARLKEWSESEKIITDLKEKHRSIAKELGADPDTLDHIESLLSELETLAKGINYLKDAPKKAMDRLQSLGERLSSPLMTVALRELANDKPVSNFDVRQVMRTSPPILCRQTLLIRLLF